MSRGDRNACPSAIGGCMGGRSRPAVCGGEKWALREPFTPAGENYGPRWGERGSPGTSHAGCGELQPTFGRKGRPKDKGVRGGHPAAHGGDKGTAAGESDFRPMARSPRSGRRGITAFLQPRAGGRGSWSPCGNASVLFRRTAAVFRHCDRYGKRRDTASVLRGDGSRQVAAGPGYWLLRRFMSTALRPSSVR